MRKTRPTSTTYLDWLNPSKRRGYPPYTKALLLPLLLPTPPPSLLQSLSTSPQRIYSRSQQNVAILRIRCHCMRARVFVYEWEPVSLSMRALVLALSRVLSRARALFAAFVYAATAAATLFALLCLAWLDLTTRIDSVAPFSDCGCCVDCAASAIAALNFKLRWKRKWNFFGIAFEPHTARSAL